MISNFKFNKKLFSVLALLMISISVFSQNNKSRFKAQVALGLNSPSQNGFVSGFEGKSINLPTVNLGFQYMFKPLFGAKLDYGFNRISNKKSTQEFKLNYTRINLQLVYDTNNILRSLPQRLGIFIHAGPGYSMIEPLSNYTQNKTSYLNAMAGAEFHYGISDNLSLFTDLSYIYSFQKEFPLISKGYGSFNGNMLTFTVGLSISLSGCYYCERRYD